MCSKCFTFFVAFKYFFIITPNMTVISTLLATVVLLYLSHKCPKVKRRIETIDFIKKSISCSTLIKNNQTINEFVKDKGSLKLL